jgi:hypothetical protein
MQTILTTKKHALKIIVPVLIFFCGALAGFAIASPQQATTAARGEVVSIMVDSGVGDIIIFNDLTPLEGETLFALTRRAVQAKNIAFGYKDYAGLGAFVTQIGPAIESSNGAYWQFWVNNVYAQAGADLYEVQPGDVIVWKFTSSKP